MLIISRIREGIPVSCLRKLASTLGMNVPQFLSAVGMSKISVERRSKGERVLTVNGGNLLVRIAQVYRITLDMFGSQELAGNWLKQDLCILGGASPLSLCDTEFGADLVRRQLRAIEHGMPV